MLGERLADQELPEPPTEPRQRQGGGAAVRALRRRRLGARPGDEVDRRGDGDRRATSRPRSARRRRRPASRCRARGPCSSPSPTPTSRRRRSSRRASTTSASGSSPPRGTAQAISRMGVPVTAINKIAEGSPHVVDYIRSGEVDLVINTPTGSGARSDGYEIRTAAVRHGHPLHHDDDRRLGRRAGDLRRSASDGAERALAAGAAREPRRPQPSRARAPRRARSDRGAGDDGGSLAPPGRRLVRGRRATGAAGGYRIFSALDAGGPEPRGGPVLHARRGATAGARATGAPILPRAFSVAEATRRAATACGSTSWSRRVGPGHRAARRARAGRGPVGHRPARAAVLARRASSAPEAAGRDPRRRRDRHRAAGDLAPPARRARASPARVLLGFRDREHSGGLELFDCSRGPARQRGRPRGPPRLRDRPARGAARGRRRREPPPSTPAGRRRCSRRCGRCAPSAASPPSWRWRRRWRAASAPASAARCRSPTAATCASASTGRWSTRRRIETALVAGSGH